MVYINEQVNQSWFTLHWHSTTSGPSTAPVTYSFVLDCNCCEINHRVPVGCHWAH